MQFIGRIFFFTLFFSTCFIHTAHSLDNPIILKAIPWFLNADGQWITHVKVMNSKSEIFFTATDAEVTSVPSWYSKQREIVIHLSPKTPQKQPVVVTAFSVETHKEVGNLSIPSPAAQYTGLQFTVKAIGPYLINMGWFNLSQADQITHYRIYRKDQMHPQEVLVATLEDPQNFFHDDAIVPNQKYTYRLVGYTHSGKTISAQKQVSSPAMMKSSPLRAMQGVGATLFFSSDPSSTEYFKHFSPKWMMQKAKELHMNYIQLRTVYGSYTHTVSQEQQQWMDQILDAAHEEGIAVFSWSIPQRVASNTLAADLAMAAYTTPKGNTFAGISVDLEIGDDYIRNLPTKTAQQQISDFVKYLRKAVGPDYLFSVIVYSPQQNALDDFPFKSIGKYASIVQPMEFWHHYLAYHHHKYTEEEVRSAIANAIQETRLRVGTNIPINVIGQMTDLNDDKVLTGIPTGEEITTALEAAKANGAWGVSFYNWSDTLFVNGAPSPQAQALKNFVW